MRRYPAALILVILLLAGCGLARPDPPKVVYVTVEKPVGVPEALSRPCPAQHATARTVDAVVTAYNANLPVQEDCDARMARIRALAPPPEKQP